MPRAARARRRQRSQSEPTPASALWRDACGLGILAATLLGFFWRALLLRGFLIHSDICYFFEPVKGLLHESLRQGRLPLWSPHIHCGYPVAAEGQIAALYPVSLLISWLLPSPAAINWLVVFHLLLAAISMYALVRWLGLPAFCAWLSAFTFSFSGYLFAHLHHVSLVCAAGWLPLVLLFADRAQHGPLLPNAVLAAAGWAASALCGHPQTVFYTSLLVIFWLVWRWLSCERAQRRSQARRLRAVLALVFGLGLTLAAVQLLLTAEASAAAPHGQRGDLDYVTSFSLRVKHLFGTIAPNWEGTPAFNTYAGDNYYWEYVLYIGLMPLALALVGAATRRGRVLAGLAVAAIILALAHGNPLYQGLRFLPGFADFRVPARFIFVYTFAASLLAARGWQAIVGWRWVAQGRRALAVGGLVAAVSCFDLLSFDRSLAPLARRELFSAPNPVVRELAGDPGWWRAVIVPPSTIDARWVPPGGWAANPDGWAEARLLLPADVPMAYGLRIVGGYAGLVDPRMEQFTRSAYAAAQSGDLRLLSLIGTRYLALPPQVSLDGVPRAAIGPFTLYRNPDAFPRVFAVAGTIPARDKEEAHLLTVELARSGRLAQTAVVEGGPVPSSGAAPPRTEITTLREPRPEQVMLGVRVDRDCLLVLNERWDPGWRLRVDGERLRPLRVDAVLMGAPLTAGEHSVEFSYRPRGLVVGRAISLAALALCLVLLLVPRLGGQRG